MQCCANCSNCEKRANRLEDNSFAYYEHYQICKLNEGKKAWEKHNGKFQRNRVDEYRVELDYYCSDYNGHMPIYLYNWDNTFIYLDRVVGIANFEYSLKPTGFEAAIAPRHHRINVTRYQIILDNGTKLHCPRNFPAVWLRYLNYKHKQLPEPMPDFLLDKHTAEA